MMNENDELTVVVGGRGKTGRRVVDLLRAEGRPVRGVSRSSDIRFDWHDESTWGPALEGATALYLTYHPDLTMPGAPEQLGALSRMAVRRGVRKLVLLSGRGEPERVHAAETAVRQAGTAWTILECAAFMQNFDEGVLAPQDGAVVFPGGEVREPFVDCDDIAEVAVAALTDSAHDGQTYDLTGPELLGFGQATAALAEASGRTLHYVPVSFEQYAEMLAEVMPPAEVEFTIDLMRSLFDGHNESLSGDVERVLGRPARRFAGYAQAAYGAAR